MILSAQSIRSLIRITPFHESSIGVRGLSFGLGPAGYDVRLQDEVLVPPQGWVLGSVLEHVELPNNVVGSVHDKSTWARLGIALQNTTIEPGWHGWLTLEISNHSEETVKLPAGVPVAKLRFDFLDQPTDQPYSGRYQAQGAGAKPAKIDGG
jgi:dCTP deaminase